MADGSAVVVLPGDDALALNADAAALWPERPRALRDLEYTLEARGSSATAAALAVRRFVAQLSDSGVAWLDTA